MKQRHNSVYVMKQTFFILITIYNRKMFNMPEQSVQYQFPPKLKYNLRKLGYLETE